MLSFMKCRILVVGDIMLDEYLATSVERISPEAPVPVARIRQRWSVPGGAANVARNLSCLGCQTTLAGLRGHDATGDQLQRLLEVNNIKNAMFCTNERPTASKTRIVAQGQQLLRLDNEEQSDVPPSTLEKFWSGLPALLDSMDAVILSDYDKGLFRRFTNGDSLAARIIARCHARRIPVLVDPKGADWERYAHADCITPNTKEMAEAASIGPEPFDKLCAGARLLMQQYDLSRILLTRSEKGMALLEGPTECKEIPTQAREVADVSGAGDTVIAVTAACVAKGMPWLKAAETANLAAGVVVGKAGTSPIELVELHAAIVSQCP